MSILVTLSLATICFTYKGNNECHPALVGKNASTPVGEYTVARKRTKAPGYGGDILQFHETRDDVYAIHRVWLLKPEQRRMQRLKGNIIDDRYVSAGCINVEPEVYTKLIDCCSNDRLTIK
jgi:hypothetical protein